MGYDSPWKGEEEQFLTELAYPLKPPYPRIPTLSIHVSKWRLACRFCPVSPLPVAWRDVFMCVLGRGYTDRGGRAAVPWKTLFVAYRSTRPSMLSDLNLLSEWKCNLFSCWDGWKWILSGASSVLNSAMPRDGLSSQLEQRGVHWGKVWWTTSPLLVGLQTVSVWLG